MHLYKSADDTKLNIEVNMLEEKDAVQKEIDSPEMRACVNFVWFIKANCKVLHLVWDYSQCQYRRDDEWIESSFPEKD